MLHVFSPPAHLEDFRVSFVRIGPLFGEHIVGLSLPNGTSLVRVHSHNGRTIAEAPIPGEILSVVFSICGRYVMIADSVSGVAISIIHSMQTEFQLKVPCVDTQRLQPRAAAAAGCHSETSLCKMAGFTVDGTHVLVALLSGGLLLFRLP